MTKNVSLISLFAVFAKIGTFTVGGGYAMIPLIEREMEKRGWISGEELTDIVVLAQSAPGIMAVNMAIYAGYRVRGWKGSIAATIGAVLPSFLIILGIAAFFTSFRDNPTVVRIFKGVRPVAVALILTPMVNMARRSNSTWWAWLITAASLFAVAFLRFSPVYIILIVIVAAYAVTRAMEGRRK